MSDSTRDEYTDSVDWQLPIEGMTDRTWDVLIIGAGPAGSTAAYHLSRKGYEVLLVDMAHFPRRKVCGDCMITDVEPNLAGMDLLETVRRVGRELAGLKIYSPSRHSFLVRGRFLTLKRPILDTILARNAVDAGATFTTGQVVDLRVEEDESVSAGTKRQTGRVRARLGILATGARISLARKLGVVTREKPSALAMRCYIRSSKDLSSLILCYERDILPGYGWIVPLGNNEYNLGCGYFLNNSHRRNMRKCFDEFISSFPPARELMSGAEILAPPRSGAIRCGLSGTEPIYRNSIILAGETIGTTFPLSGEGIGQAMTTGVIAAAVVSEALLKNDREQLRQYPMLLESKLGPRHKGFQHAQKWVSRPWINNFMARRMTKSQYLRDACADFIYNSENSHKVYSLGAVLKSFVQ
jgi:geranylgeranyl reductase family protein